jgi:hypothetical protein
MANDEGIGTSLETSEPIVVQKTDDATTEQLESQMNKITLNDEGRSDKGVDDETSESPNLENKEPDTKQAKSVVPPRKGYFYEHDDRLGDKEEQDAK